MSEKIHYWLGLGAASIVGSGVTALGNAFGFSRRIKNCEDSDKCLKKLISECYTKAEQDNNRDATKELMATRFDHHTKAISELKSEQKEGFDGVYTRLNQLIDVSKRGHCE